MPCFNEEPNLPELVERLESTFARSEVEGEAVLVDDGSRDGTWTVMQELAATRPWVRPVRHERNRGLAQAWHTALESSTGDLACLIDADLQYQPEDVLRLLWTYDETKCDLVQGWRSAVGRQKQPRYYWSRGLNWILKALFGLRLRDCKSGFVLASREVLQDLLTFNRRYHYWQTFIAVAAQAKGYTIEEIETIFEERRAGESFLTDFPLKVILRAFADLWPALLEYRFSEPRRVVTGPFVTSPPRPAPDTRAYGGRWRAYRASFNQTHWMITRDVFRHLDDLEESQWLPAADIRELQSRKLRRLVRHAYRHVPYYRRRMREAGVEPDDIRGVEDLHLLPLLTKADIRENLYFDILSDNHRKQDVQRITTSGSTGEPFVCYVDRSQLEFRWAATMRSTMWTGWRPGEPQVRLWHQTIGMSRSQVWRERADAWLTRRTFIPAFEVSASRLDAMLRTIERVRPALLDGYAESFNLFAAHLRDHRRLEIAPKGIISSAQSLNPSSRETIESGFGCRVFDKYGSREFSGIAYECDAHQGHHVVAEGYVVEVLKGGKPCAPGEIGEVVITDLNNYCLPFVRYRIGDLAVAMADGPCGCGRSLPRVGEIQGRVQSIIIGADGRYIPGAFFLHVLKDYEHVVRQFQVVQERRGAVTLKVVRGGRFSERGLQQALEVLRQYLGDGTEIEVELVDRIEMVRTGKRLQAISTIPLDLQSDSAELDASLRR